MTTSRRAKILALPIAAVVATLSLTACGEDSDVVAGSSATVPERLIPEVQNATDLKSKPVPAAAGADADRPQRLLTEDLVVGSGEEADITDTVRVQYVGTRFRDGQQFDSSWDRGAEPAEFPLNGVIPGFAQGIVGMKEGGRRVIVIPAEQGYGARGAGADIPPDTDLVFVVDLVEVAG